MDYFERVLEALKLQTLPLDAWELLLVDNASSEEISGLCNLKWHPNGRIIVEGQLGLTPSRIRAIKEARADVLVFSDDDTIFAPNYLEEALRIANDWPMLGAWGGQPTPEFESEPAEWALPYVVMLGLCRTKRECWSNSHDSEACPIGAGLCIRMEVLETYLKYLEYSPERRALGRTGCSLLAGEDTDMALTACDMGLGVGRFMSLSFIHLIPSRRLDLAYLLALREGMVYSHEILDSFRPAIFPRKSLPRMLGGYFLRIMRGDPYERRFQVAALKGQWRARRILASRSL